MLQHLQMNRRRIRRRRRFASAALVVFSLFPLFGGDFRGGNINKIWMKEKASTGSHDKVSK